MTQSRRVEGWHCLRPLRLGEQPVIIFPGLGQQPSYFEALFHGVSCTLYLADYKVFLVQTISKKEALALLYEDFVKLSDSEDKSLHIVTCSFGTRVWLHLVGAYPSLTYHQPVLCIAPDGFYTHPVFVLLTRSPIYPLVQKLSDCALIRKTLPFLMKYWGFNPLDINKLLEDWQHGQILRLWHMFSDPLDLDSELQKQKVWCLAGERDAIFPLKYFKKLEKKYLNHFQLLVMPQATHILSPFSIRSVVRRWLSGEHHLYENENVKPQPG
ncbi:MAG: alpha/beta hydrolase [Flavobacteriales bacterium]|nr:alpha/beta hydrolase [Flavobacteriales bacterium]MCX7768572.1 alpha/beta hydrolase [Flavobacteriales bacterium]MDW8409459.1 alpha/beta hydrolase [Flavobacteriales bacterium]